MEVSRELENDCLISETGAELFIPHSENRRKVAKSSGRKKKTSSLPCETKLTSKVCLLIGSSKVTTELGKGLSE